MNTSIKIICLSFLFALSTSAFSHQHKSEGSETEGEKVKEYTPKFSTFGKGEPVIYMGRPIFHHVGVDDLPSNVALFEEMLPPKSLGAPPHTHSHEDEVFVILKGKVHFLSGTEEIVAASGTIASLPRNHQHGFWNPYDEPAQLLVFVSPGHFSDFFQAVQHALLSSNATSPEEVGGIIATEASKLGVAIDMSQLPESAIALLQPK